MVTAKSERNLAIREAAQFASRKVVAHRFGVSVARVSQIVRQGSAVDRTLAPADSPALKLIRGTIEGLNKKAMVLADELAMTINEMHRQRQELYALDIKEIGLRSESSIPIPACPDSVHRAELVMLGGKVSSYEVGVHSHDFERLMPKDSAQGFKVPACAKEVGCKRVSERMWVHPTGHACSGRNPKEHGTD